MSETSYYAAQLISIAANQVLVVTLAAAERENADAKLASLISQLGMPEVE